MSRRSVLSNASFYYCCCCGAGWAGGALCRPPKLLGELEEFGLEEFEPDEFCIGADTWSAGCAGVVIKAVLRSMVGS